MKTFRDLKVWEKAHLLTLKVYQTTQSFPGEEKFGLVTQLRRACSSVPTNIVEGFKRGGDKDKAHFFNMAESSLEETKYHLILSQDLNYIASAQFKELYDQAEEVGRMLHTYRQVTLRRVLPSVFFGFLIPYFLLLNSIFCFSLTSGILP